jgi:hypothetical protein
MIALLWRAPDDSPVTVSESGSIRLWNENVKRLVIATRLQHPGFFGSAAAPKRCTWLFFPNERAYFHSTDYKFDAAARVRDGISAILMLVFNEHAERTA